MTATIVLLAAGMSTRYGRLKQLEAVGPKGETLLDYAVFDARRAGFGRVVLIIRKDLEGAFRAHIEPRWPQDLEVRFHHQRLEDLPGPGVQEAEPDALAELMRARKKPWGTAHALLSARDLLPEPFLLLNADDFYGQDAYSQALALIAQSRARDPGRLPVFGLVAYALGRTLTGAGGVSRGICAVSDAAWLEGVEEALEVKRTGSGFSGRTLRGTGLSLSGAELASTNLWVFTPEVFPLLEEGFRTFVTVLMAGLSGASTGVRPAEPGAMAEFLIPTEVNRLLLEGRIRVRVQETRGRFLGITHPEDWAGVAEGIRDLIRAGQYPDPLWAGIPVAGSS
jgi:hypothetical protein